MKSVLITLLAIIIAFIPIKTNADDINSFRMKYQHSVVNGIIVNSESITPSFNPKGIASINASFFSPKNFKPCSALMIDGKLISGNFYNRPILNIYSDNSIAISNKIDLTAKHAIGGGSSLIKDGKINVTREHFTKQFVLAKVNRTAIGYKDKKIIMVVATNADLFKMARIMKKLDCNGAINLDGGSSSQLKILNKTIISSGRKVPVFVIVK